MPGDRKYCHFHEYQSPDFNAVSGKPGSNGGNEKRRATEAAVKKAGFIYIYTYQAMYDAYAATNVKRMDWLYLDESIVSEKKNNLEQWHDDANILCKIGMTTNTVSRRLSEWQNTCKHPVINLTPERINTLLSYRRQQQEMAHKLSIKNLSNIFKKMSLSSKNKQATVTGLSSEDNRVPKYHTYRDGGFYNNDKGRYNLRTIENSIHRELWNQYGRALTYCYGCDETGYKRHLEWFRIPVRDLPDVLRKIDSMCLTNQ